MSWTIKSITIENFKFFKEPFTLQTNNKNVLLYGENGSGKSSIFWSFYTHFQAYAKSQVEAQKYFQPGHAQNLRNRYADPTDVSSIKINFDNNNGTEQVVEDSQCNYYCNDALIREFMKKTCMSSDFMNYKFLSSLFDFKNSQDNEVFSLFETEVLPYLDFDEPLFNIDKDSFGSMNAGDYWNELKNVYNSGKIPKNSNKINQFNQRSPQYKNYHKCINNFNILLVNKIAFLVSRANKILESDFKINARIIFTYEPAVFNRRLGNRKFDGLLHYPKIYLKAKMESANIKDQTIIEHPRSFFNEAKITCMAFALRLAILENHPTSNDSPSALFVDDLLISLDMSYRRKIIEYILRYSDSFQMFIFTHDRAFFHLVKNEIGIIGDKDKWNCVELYNMEGDDGIERPKLMMNKTYIEKALMFLHNLEIPASVNAARKAAEQEMKRLLPVNQQYSLESDNMICNLSSLLGKFSKTIQDVGLSNVIPHLQEQRKLLLNPFSHDDVDTPFYRTELLKTIEEIVGLKEIERHTIIDYNNVRTKQYEFKMNNGAESFIGHFYFLEQWDKYIYKGNEYFKSPKVELIISSSTNIKCKEWGLNRLYNSVAHSLGYNTNNRPQLLECIFDTVTGTALV